MGSEIADTELDVQVRALVELCRDHHRVPFEIVAFGELERGKRAVTGLIPASVPFVDPDTGVFELPALLVAEVGRAVGHKNDVVGPAPDHQGPVDPVTPFPRTASAPSRTSQPWQNGQWKTEWPQSSVSPGRSSVT